MNRPRLFADHARTGRRLLHTGPAALPLAASLFASPVSAQEKSETSGSTMASGDTMSPGAPVIPAVTGYSEGQEILFLHTEASDPDIAKLLSDMMGSLVLVVPSLANIPIGDLGRVYVFTNGTSAPYPSLTRWRARSASSNGSQRP